jgi:nitrate reductase (NAD(P)H)
MERVKNAGGDLTDGYWGEGNVDVAAGAVEEEKAVEILMTNPDVKNAITIDEFRKHEAAESPWFVVNDEVYDGTSFLKEHPGGAQSIEAAAGQDCTEEFMAIRMLHPPALRPGKH